MEKPEVIALPVRLLHGQPSRASRQFTVPFGLLPAAVGLRVVGGRGLFEAPTFPCPFSIFVRTVGQLTRPEALYRPGQPG